MTALVRAYWRPFVGIVWVSFRVGIIVALALVTFFESVKLLGLWSTFAIFLAPVSIGYWLHD